ncbi:MAG: hypothetical protein IJP45_07030 [Paludibacteraceae bacterium]|nr:hypothetical protein [Paludibacteraceae bacterium]MBR2166757.1 hypothetical protein [Paludibacteraceae bacterium]
MARYKPIDMVKHYQGKICQHSDTYFQKRKRTLCTGKICNPRDLAQKPYSQQEIATHTKFQAAIQAVQALTQEQIAAYKAAFDKQLKAPNPKYSYLRNYMIAQEYAKL